MPITKRYALIVFVCMVAISLLLQACRQDAAPTPLPTLTPKPTPTSPITISSSNEADNASGAAVVTEAATNTTASRAFLPLALKPYAPAEIFASQPRGVYDAALTVELTSQHPDIEIRYTLNGDTPSVTNGAIYAGPIVVEGTTVLRAVAYSAERRIPPAYVGTWSYIFPQSVLVQGNAPEGYPESWSGFSADYAIDPTIALSPTYQTELLDTLNTLPTLSVVTDIDYLFGSDGIYQNPHKSGREWERPTSIELLFADPTQNLQADAGIRLHGGASRAPENSPKHSLRLLFRSDYGPANLEFPLFTEQPLGHLATTEFDKLVLRAGYNNSWISRNQIEDHRTRALYIRDNFARETQLRMGQPAVHGRNVHLYLNGLYWGLYNLQERPDADFFASYFGGSDDEYDVMNGLKVSDGDVAVWNEMHEFYSANDLSDPEAYAQAVRYVDLENLIDFVILNHYIGNEDWDVHNWYAGRKRADGEPFIFVNWDSEFILKEPGFNGIDKIEPMHPTALFEKLRANGEFRMAVADRLYEHFFNDGALTTAAATERLNALAEAVRSPVVAESARWGDYRADVHPINGPFKTYERDDTWAYELFRLQSNYMGRRSDFIFNEYKARGLYPSIEPPIFSDGGGNVSAEFLLQLNNPNEAGSVWYTVDGSDPRPAGGGLPVGVDGGDSAEITLSTTTPIKARIYNATTAEWSALREATFVVDASLDELIISELMYNPLEDDDYEFVELKNTGHGTLLLDGVYFSDGIEYRFPANTLLAPAATYVLAKSPQLFAERYGFAPDNANGYGGRLSNGGETIALSDANGERMFAFTYDDEEGWPTEADGEGYSLVRSDLESLNRDPNNPANWQRSEAVQGSPGE